MVVSPPHGPGTGPPNETMAKIEGIRVKNFRALKDVTLGRLWDQPDVKPLTSMTAVIGKNGTGKSTLFDAFGFLSDCLKGGVEEACDAHGRGGFEKLLSQGKEGPIGFEVCYKEDDSGRSTYNYELAVGIGADKRPYVEKERLVRVEVNAEDQFRWFLLLSGGSGIAWKGKEGGQENGMEDGITGQKVNRMAKQMIQGIEQRLELMINRRETSSGDDDETSSDKLLVNLDDFRKLGVATLGSLKRHPVIASFRRFMEGWYLSYFTPDAARGLPLVGPQKQLNIHGDNLGNVVQFMMRDHPKQFHGVLKSIAEKIPGVDKIDTKPTADGRLLLRFNDKGFRDPFYAQQMSDGTLKVFAYLLLLEAKEPPPFLCIEEPENGLYHKLLEPLVREFREHATREGGGSQVFVTTHQPYLVDALDPEEVWILEKGADGFASIRRASDIEIVKNMVAEGLPLGGLWYSDYLDAEGK